MLTCLRAHWPVRWCHVGITWNKQEALVEVRVKSGEKSMLCTPRYITQLTKMPCETRSQPLTESNLKRQSVCVGSDSRARVWPSYWSLQFWLRSHSRHSLWHSCFHMRWWQVCSRYYIYNPMGVLVSRFPLKVLYHKMVPIWKISEKQWRIWNSRPFPSLQISAFREAKNTWSKLYPCMFKLAPNCFLELAILNMDIV